MNISSHLTSDDFDAVARRTPIGAAGWSGTGPEGKTCRQCRHYEACGRGRNGGCRLYCTFMHVKKAPPIPGATPSCRYFED